MQSLKNIWKQILWAPTFCGAFLLLLASCSETSKADATLPGTPSGPVDPLFLPTAVMPAFLGLDRTDPDVCLDGTCRFNTLSGAAAAAADGATIIVGPGIYQDCVLLRGKSLAFVGLTRADGERPIITEACGRKAAFIANGDNFLLKNMRIYKMSVPDRNGACVRLEGQNKLQRAAIINVYCDRSENGVLGSVGDGSLIIRGSHFEYNGANRGQAHGIYVGGGGEVWIDRSVVANSKGLGHSVKVGANRLVITKSIIAGLNGRNSRSIDFYGGGVLSIRDSVIQQGSNSDNHDMIALGMEQNRINQDSPQATYIADSWMIYDDPNRCCRWFLKGTDLGPRIVQNVALVTLNDTKLSYEGQNSKSVKIYKSRKQAGLPAYDGTIKSLPPINAYNQ